MISKIVITGDCQRPIPGQHPNIDWLFDLLRYQIEAVSGIKPLMLSGGPILPLADWLKTYVSGHPTSWHIQRPELTSPSEVLVIGFELPLSSKEAFDREGVQFIDLIAHPVRYMDDLLMGVACGARWLGGAYLPTAAVGEESFFVHANLVRTQMRHLPKLPLPDGVRLVVGQTEVDRSVLKDGRVLSLVDFKAELQKLAEGGRKVLFKPHPANLNSSAAAMMRELGTEVTNENLYRLLSQDHLSMVAGISSSCLVEARYFGKQVQFFGDEWAKAHHPIAGEDFLSCRFWEGLLGEVMTTRPAREPRFIGGQSRLRRSCLSWWGFDFIEQHGKA